MPKHTFGSTTASATARRLMAGASAFAIGATMSLGFSTGAAAQGQSASAVTGLEEIVV